MANNWFDSDGNEVSPNQNGTAKVSIVPTDEDGNAIAPTALTYSLYRLKTDEIINTRENIAVSPLGTSMSIALLKLDNQVFEDANEDYKRLIIFKYTYTSSLGAGLEGREDLEYEITPIEHKVV